MTVTRTETKQHVFFNGKALRKCFTWNCLSSSRVPASHFGRIWCDLARRKNLQENASNVTPRVECRRKYDFLLFIDFLPCHFRETKLTKNKFCEKTACTFFYVYTLQRTELKQTTICYRMSGTN
uniref:(northern house mosquito) hypothetical protein n=1 Tax=Culex pipiens TaxID=7175 RepID=A0A8D8CSR7_CULPI